MNILLPIIGIGIPQPARIKTAKGKMSEKQRPAAIGPQRQLNALKLPAIEKMPRFGIAIAIGVQINAIARRSRRQHISDQTFVPAPDIMVEGKPIVRAPVPA